MTNPSDSSQVALLKRRIRVARGREPGDLLLTGGQVVNVFTQQVQPANVVIADGWIAGVGPFDWRARQQISLEGSYLLPGLVDAHMHLESTLLTPWELARLIVPHGTAVLVADPHEVGNVLGVRGIELLLSASKGLPLDVFFMAPSCVPATSWDDAGATLDAAAIQQLLGHERVLGLAEVMDFPALLEGEPGVLEKIVAASAGGGVLDGHAPGLNPRELVAYAAAGIRSDHESTTIEEALAKAALGMLVQVRDGSMARNLQTLAPLAVQDRLGDWCLATDDIYPDELLAHGHIDHLLRQTIAAGVPLPRAVRHATLVPARHYGLRHHGAVAPGYLANLLALSADGTYLPQLVVHRGKVVARDGNFLADGVPPAIPAENTVHLGPISAADFALAVPDRPVPVIRVLPEQIVTVHETRQVPREAGRWVFDPRKDLVLVASIERHRASGRTGLALAAGFDLKRHGAIGSSVAHDAHNLIVAGTNAEDMLLCVRALEEMGGGFVVAAEGAVTAQVPLPVAGLLSTASAEEICRQMTQLNEAATALGCPLPNPIGALSFLALPVIPELRITTQGLFDVVRQEFIGRHQNPKR